MIDLINKIVLHICYRCGEDEYARGIKHDCDDCILSEVIDELSEVLDETKFLCPSANAVQGEWIDTPKGYYCSECGKWCDRGTYNYCPNCGKRMDTVERG